MDQQKNSRPLGQTIVIVAGFVILAAVVLIVVDKLGVRSRDTQRVSAVRSMQNLLSLYASNNGGNYPTSLSQLVPTYVPVLPVEPSAHSPSGYTYAALGSGSNCNSYHLGVILEDTSNIALATDADSAPQSTCDGSNPDFNGLSGGAAGQGCGVNPAGTGQVESCYDVTP